MVHVPPDMRPMMPVPVPVREGGLEAEDEQNGREEAFETGVHVSDLGRAQAASSACGSARTRSSVPVSYASMVPSPFVRLVESAGKMEAAQFLQGLILAVPYRIHTVLTGTAFSSPPVSRTSYTLPRDRTPGSAHRGQHSLDPLPPAAGEFAPRRQHPILAGRREERHQTSFALQPGRYRVTRKRASK